MGFFAAFRRSIPFQSRLCRFPAVPAVPHRPCPPPFHSFAPTAASKPTEAPSPDAQVTDAPTEAPEESAQTAVPTAPRTEPPERKRVLVVVFSATGTTSAVAQRIASIENADLYEIKAAQEYTSADLNWHDSGSRATIEQNDKSARPAIGSESISLEGYERIYIGYPIWWGEEPRIMDTFVETYDFGSITMIPFCTSGSSGIGRSGQNLAGLAGSGTWLEGRRFGGGVSEDELRAWIGALG